MIDDKLCYNKQTILIIIIPIIFNKVVCDYERENVTETKNPTARIFIANYSSV